MDKGVDHGVVRVRGMGGDSCRMSEQNFAQKYICRARGPAITEPAQTYEVQQFQSRTYSNVCYAVRFVHPLQHC